jgi:hypothetical protein
MILVISPALIVSCAEMGHIAAGIDVAIEEKVSVKPNIPSDTLVGA